MRVGRTFMVFNSDLYDVKKVLVQVVESTLIVWEDLGGLGFKSIERLPRVREVSPLGFDCHEWLREGYGVAAVAAEPLKGLIPWLLGEKWRCRVCCRSVLRWRWCFWFSRE